MRVVERVTDSSVSVSFDRNSPTYIFITLGFEKVSNNILFQHSPVFTLIITEFPVPTVSSLSFLSNPVPLTSDTRLPIFLTTI